MKRLVILGDSLGLPTGVKNGKQTKKIVEYEETYPYLMKQLLPGWEIISTCKRSNRTDKQAHPQWLSDDIVLYKPDIVVVHLGICDCAPRLFNRYESFILSHLPAYVREPILVFFSKHRYFMTKHFEKVFVKKAAFELHMRRLIDVIRNRQAMAIVVGIADTNEQNKLKSYHYENNIRDYNSILSTIAKETNTLFINMFDEGDKVLLEDGIHLNAEGCRLLATRLSSVVSELPVDQKKTDNV